VRSLAFRWIRVLFRCWKDRQPYDEARYLEALQKRNGHPREGQSCDTASVTEPQGLAGDRTPE
jgi:hypothetical protein